MKVVLFFIAVFVTAALLSYTLKFDVTGIRLDPE